MHLKQCFVSRSDDELLPDLQERLQRYQRLLTSSSSRLPDNGLQLQTKIKDLESRIAAAVHAHLQKSVAPSKQPLTPLHPNHATAHRPQESSKPGLEGSKQGAVQHSLLQCSGPERTALQEQKSSAQQEQQPSDRAKLKASPSQASMQPKLPPQLEDSFQADLQEALRRSLQSTAQGLSQGDGRDKADSGIDESDFRREVWLPSEGSSNDEVPGAVGVPPPEGPALHNSGTNSSAPSQHLAREKVSPLQFVRNRNRQSGERRQEGRALQGQEGDLNQARTNDFVTLVKGASSSAAGQPETQGKATAVLSAALNAPFPDEERPPAKRGADKVGSLISLWNVSYFMSL